MAGYEVILATAEAWWADAVELFRDESRWMDSQLEATTRWREGERAGLVGWHEVAAVEAQGLFRQATELGEQASDWQEQHPHSQSRRTAGAHEFTQVATVSVSMARQFVLAVSALWLDFPDRDAAERILLRFESADAHDVVRDVADTYECASVDGDWRAFASGRAAIESMNTEAMQAWTRALGAEYLELRRTFVPETPLSSI